MKTWKSLFHTWTPRWNRQLIHQTLRWILKCIRHRPPISQEMDYAVVLTMVQKLNAQLGNMHMDNDKIRSVCDGLLRDYRLRDEAIDNVTRLVKKAVDCPATQRPYQDTAAPYAMVPPDLIDADGNLWATDIGITWQGSETFLHVVRVVGPRTAGSPPRHQPTTSTPYIPVREHDPCHMSSPPPPQPSYVELPDHHVHRPLHDNRQGYRPATPIQRFNNKTLNWPSWLRYYLAPGGGCEVLFSPGLSVCLSVCLCVCVSVCVSGRYFGILYLGY